MSAALNRQRVSAVAYVAQPENYVVTVAGVPTAVIAGMTKNLHMLMMTMTTEHHSPFGPEGTLSALGCVLMVYLAGLVSGERGLFVADRARISEWQMTKK